MPRPQRIRPKLPAGMQPNPRKRNRKQARVRVIFSLGAHANADDYMRTRKLGRLLRPGDLYFKEGTSTQIEQHLLEGREHEALTSAGIYLQQRSSAERLTPKELRERALETVRALKEQTGSEFRKAEARTIAELGARGVNAEVEWYEGKKAYDAEKRNFRIHQNRVLLGEQLGVGDLEGALRAYENLLEEVAREVEERNKRIRGQLQERIENAIRQKKNQRILVRLGEGHDDIAKELRDIHAGDSRIRIDLKRDVKTPVYWAERKIIEMIQRGKRPSRQQMIGLLGSSLVFTTLLDAGIRNRKYVKGIVFRAAKLITERDLREVIVGEQSTPIVQQKVLALLRRKGLLPRREAIPLPAKFE